MKRLLLWLGVLVVLVVAGLVAAVFLVDANYFRPILESQLSAVLHREVKIGALALKLLDGEVTASDISIGDDPAFGKEPFLAAKSFHAAVELRPLILNRTLNVTGVTLEGPEVRLILRENGAWNFSTLGQGAAAPATAPQAEGSRMQLSVKSVKIIDGKFSMVRAGLTPQTFEDMDIELTELSASAPIGFAMTAKRSGGGTIHVEGKAGPMSGSRGALPPIDAKFSVPPLDLVAAGLVERSSGVAGVAQFAGQVSTKGNIVELTGNLRGEKWKLIEKGSPAGRPVEIAFTVAHDVARRAGQLRRADIRIGKAASTLTGSYNLNGAEPTFAFKLKGDRMPLTEFAAVLPAFNVVLPAGSTLESGTATLNATVAGTLSGFSAIGPFSLNDAKLANFDLGTKMRVVQFLAGLPATPTTEIQTLAAMVKHTPNGTAIDDLNLVVVDVGNLTGEGTVGADNSLDFRMRTTIKTSGAIMRAVGQKGDTTVPFSISGTASNPVIKADVKAIASEKIEQLKKDPIQTINAAKDLFNRFRKPKPEEPPKQ